MSFTASVSAAADTVTVCAVDQVPAVNVSGDGDSVTSGLPVRDSVTVTSPVGREVRTTV